MERKGKCKVITVVTENNPKALKDMLRDPELVKLLNLNNFRKFENNTIANMSQEELEDWAD